MSGTRPQTLACAGATVTSQSSRQWPLTRPSDAGRCARMFRDGSRVDSENAVAGEVVRFPTDNPQDCDL